jgi:hypothetical protein
LNVKTIYCTLFFNQQEKRNFSMASSRCERADLMMVDEERITMLSLPDTM